MEYSGTFSAAPGNFRKKRKKFLTNPIDNKTKFLIALYNLYKRSLHNN